MTPFAKAFLEGRTLTPTRGKARFSLDMQYEKPGLGDTAEDDPNKAIDLATCKWVGTLLEAAYPGHPWQVQASLGKQRRDGLIRIRLNGIMPPNYWFNLKFSAVLEKNGGGKRAVQQAAGELLERYNLRRGNFDLDDWRLALNAMPLHSRQTGRGHLAPLL